MPFAQITPHADPKIKHLEECLVQEWTHPQEENTEPVIIDAMGFTVEEADRAGIEYAPLEAAA